MKTLFGRELAKIRLDNNISLKDMAAGLKVPSSYLSAVESASEKTGKSLTPEFLERILGFLCLLEEEEIKLRNAAAASTGECRIDTRPLDEMQLDTLTVFARKVGNLSPEEMNKIREVLR